MKTLDEIAIQHGTDKATVHPLIKGHAYAPHYDRIFTPIRDLPIRFMEIGVGGGESIKTWLEYFPNAKVFGVDIVCNTNPWNTADSNADPRYTFMAGDQAKPEFWTAFIEKNGGSFDVIVDDGGHYDYQIITSFTCLWPHIVPGGLYCIEDLAVAYGGSPFTNAGWQNHMDFVKDKLDDINRHPHIESLHFSKELAIIKKAL